MSKILLEQWTAHELYFSSFLLENLTADSTIYVGPRSSDLRLYDLFMGYILPILNDLNMEFQKEMVRLHS